MQSFRQNERDIINPYTEIHYAILSSFPNTKFPHQHDFFEVFLLLKGQQKYVTENFNVLLEPGSLVLVRPHEIHSREYIQPGLHINVAFSNKIASDLFQYLCDATSERWLLESTNFPYVKLTTTETSILRKRLEELGSYDLNSYQVVKTKLRIIVFDLFTNYFMRYIEENSFPSEGWLKATLLEMENIDNFSLGVKQLIAVSGKSHEHLCRIFKEELHCTPTQYINKLRLNYSANLLIHSDIDIVDICFQVGFESLSHFYHLFKKQYALTPAQFKKKYQVFGQ